jgi:hypothetical protein
MPPVSRAKQTDGFAACDAGATATPTNVAAAATTVNNLSVFFKFPPEGSSE